jgi:DNA integrity scanning protein DisA with diadenylate cyclase activity
MLNAQRRHVRAAVINEGGQRLNVVVVVKMSSGSISVQVNSSFSVDGQSKMRLQHL